jgi:hypothetical protein
MQQAEGKAVKVISALLQYLPPQHTYKIIFMQRPMQEVLASQAVMLERQGAQGGKADDQTLGTVFAQHLDHIEHWLAMQQNMTVLPVNYHETVANPEEIATRVTQFLDLPLVVDAMVRTVDPRLHRQRR